MKKVRISADLKRKRSGLDGGAEGIRTPDLLIANETLYQLSYDPSPKTARRCRLEARVARTGFLDGARASQRGAWSPGEKGWWFRP